MIFIKHVIRKLISRAILLLLFAFSFQNIHAQSEHPYGVWLGYQLRKLVGNKFSWNNDLQIRFTNVISTYDYTLVRTALQYDINKNFNATAGILYGQDNFNEKNLPVWKNEKRIFQEGRFLAGDLKNVLFQVILKLEERWFDLKRKDNETEKVFALRSRYRVDFRKSIGNNWRLMASNEYMLQNVNGKSGFNQDRIWAGVSRLIGINEIQVQLMQIIWKAPDATVLRVNFLHQLKS
jgi:hypothetical protein